MTTLTKRTTTPAPAQGSAPAQPVATPQVRYLGRDAHTNGPACAIVPRQIRPDELQPIYNKLPAEARHQMALAKRWRVWGVLCTDAWAVEHARLKEAP